jgi:hypothetical protein
MPSADIGLVDLIPRTRSGESAVILFPMFQLNELQFRKQIDWLTFTFSHIFLRLDAIADIWTKFFRNGKFYICEVRPFLRHWKATAGVIQVEVCSLSKDVRRREKTSATFKTPRKETELLLCRLLLKPRGQLLCCEAKVGSNNDALISFIRSRLPGFSAFRQPSEGLRDVIGNFKRFLLFWKMSFNFKRFI